MISRLPSFALLLAAIVLASCANKDHDATTKDAAVAPLQAVARGRIDIEGGLLRLAMPREGTVVEVKAHEGEHVRKGQLLARLDDKPSQLAMQSAEAEQQQAQAQIVLLQSRLKAAQQRAQRIASAAQAGAADGQSADDARQATEQLQGELESARANVALAMQKIAAARYELGQRSLLAPVDAEVVSRTIQPGATVSPQAGPAFVLLPDAPRIVRAELNAAFVDTVHEGMQAEIVDDGDGSSMAPRQARVLRVGPIYGNSTLEDDPMTRANTRTVECVLVFDQSPADLRIGQRVLVRFPRTDAGKQQAAS